MKKTIKVAFLLVAMLAILTGCSSNVDNTASTTAEKANTTKTEVETSKEVVTIDKVDFEAAAKKQMAAPEVGEEIAIFHVKGYGDIKVKFFKDVAPKAVENFLTHAKNG